MSLNSLHKLNSAIIDMAQLVRNLPGRVSSSLDFSKESDEHVINVTGYEPDAETKLYECKFGFNFGKDAESRLKNFSIHNPERRGQGLAAQVIANLVDVTRNHPTLKRVSLTAELERGAMVWLKMGWLPEENSFARLQKKCQPKLDLLQQLLPADEKPSSTVYGIFRDLFDHETTTNPIYAWSIVDSGASYPLGGLRRVQDVANITDKAARLEAIKGMAAKNAIVMTPETLARADKTLVFMRNIDLDNLAREGQVKVAAIILAWESWRGALDIDNPLQMARLELALNKVRPEGFGRCEATTGPHMSNSHSTRDLHV